MIEIYWFIAIAAIVLGLLLPQQGRKKIYYIVIMAAIHTFVCGFRYQYLTGDLQAYHNVYVTLPQYGWSVMKSFRKGGTPDFICS